MTTKIKKTKVQVSGLGVIAMYGYLTKKQYDEFFKYGIDDIEIEDLVDYFAFHGVYSDKMIATVGRSKIGDLDEVNEIYPIKTYPERFPVPFKKGKKYALLSLEIEQGDWVNDEVEIENEELLNFELRRFDLGNTSEFSVVNVAYDGMELERGELDQRKRFFYLINQEDWSVHEL